MILPFKIRKKYYASILLLKNMYLQYLKKRSATLPKYTEEVYAQIKFICFRYSKGVKSVCFLKASLKVEEEL